MERRRIAPGLALAATVLAATAAAAVDATDDAAAQEAFPTRPIEMIVPYPPGGNTDLMARALQAELSRLLGQPVVILNRGGAAGTIGNAELARSRADGYVIGMSPNNPLRAQPHQQRLSYTLDSFRYLCLVYDNPQVVVGSRNMPFWNLQGMIAYGRTQAEALVFGSPGQGSTQHILMAGLLKAAEVEGLHVPYTGAGPMAQAALGGQIHVFVESASIPAASGLPVLGVFGRKRLASLPDVPTLAEEGFPMEGTSAGGLIAPAGIPDAAADVLETACAAAVQSEEFRQVAERLSSVPHYMSGREFRERFAAESEANRTVLRELGLAREE